jgi:type II secretory pathway pseudopilin PulG
MELLVVISILALLAAILFPVFDTARRASRRAVCLSNLRQIGIAIGMYAGDYGDLYPRGTDPADTESDIWTTDPGFKKMLRLWPSLPTALYPYTKSGAIWRCPDDTGFNGLDTKIDLAGNPVPMTAQPSLFAQYQTSYLYRTSLAVEEVSYPCAVGYEPFRPYTEHSGAEVSILWDASGSWHGGWTLDKKRYNVLMSDGHATSETWERMQMILALSCSRP